MWRPSENPSTWVRAISRGWATWISTRRSSRRRARRGTRPNPPALNEAALHRVSPFFLLEGLPNNLFSYLSAMYEFMGPNGSFSSLSSCGAQALENCDRVLRFGEADVGLVVGCGSWAHPMVLLELDGLGILSRAKEGAASFRPFDKRRDGFFPGEGAAPWCSRAPNPPVGRARSPWAASWGRRIARNSPLIAISPFRPERCAIRWNRQWPRRTWRPRSGFHPSPRSATPRGDAGELSALLEYGDRAKDPVPLAGWKPYTGHMGSASDLAEIVLGLCALKDGRLPPTPGFAMKEEAFETHHILTEECAVAGAAFLSLSHGIGGQSSATIVAAP